MLLRKVIAVYSENHTKTTNTPREQNAELKIAQMMEEVHTSRTYVCFTET
jgi:hypothetical protein